MLGLHQMDGSELVAAVTASLTESNSQQQDVLAVAQNGGLTGSTAEDADMADAEGDDGLDDEDDMMDKISSSPSIDDGGYPLPLTLPQSSFSLFRQITPISSTSQACGESSSPFEEVPAFYPLRPLCDQVDKDVVTGAAASNSNYQYHHLPGEYPDDSNDCGSENVGVGSHATSSTLTDAAGVFIELYDEENDLDPCAERQSAELSEQDHESMSDEDDVSDIIPYEGSEIGDDDDCGISFTDNPRFIDSGWGGECLQELEDIDFEFVYALHTFVATVEGQANATKGDTMVLLDDSNSYWWLVRVVKDSSIGGSSLDVCCLYGYSFLLQDTYPQNISKHQRKD